MNELHISLDGLVNDAKIRREVYFDHFHDDEIFGVMSSISEEKHGVQITTEDIDSIVSESLDKRGIKYLAELEHIPKNQVAILGETYHFVYKFSMRNHQYRNPVPLLRLTFDALEPIDDEYAAKFLFAVCDFMPKDGKKRHSDVSLIAALFQKILPMLFDEYKTSIKSIERHSGDEEKYKRMKSNLDSFYKKSLDLALEITEGVIKHPMPLDWKEFKVEREKRQIRLDFKTSYRTTYVT